MKITALIIALFSLLFQGGGQSVVIPIQNPSFEQVSGTLPTVEQCGHWGWDGQGSFRIPGWTWTTTDPGGGTGVFQPANPNPCSYELPPDGSIVAYAGGGTVSQDVGMPQPGVYVLKFFVANRWYSYPGHYTAAVSIGTNQLCSTSGFGVGDFTEVTLVCPAPGYLTVDHGLGFAPGHLIISMHSESVGWQLFFDDVSLTFTPN